MTVDEGVAVGLCLFLWHVPLKKKLGSEFRVSVHVPSVLSFTGSCGNTLCTQLFLWLQLCRNSELIMELTSANKCSYLITMPIIDDDVVIMCPSDLIG